MFVETCGPVSKYMEDNNRMYEENLGTSALIHTACKNIKFMCKEQEQVVRVPGYRSGGPGSIPGTTR
jgi:hypothetical protein